MEYCPILSIEAASISSHLGIDHLGCPSSILFVSIRLFESHAWFATTVNSNARKIENGDLDHQPIEVRPYLILQVIGGGKRADNQ